MGQRQNLCSTGYDYANLSRNLQLAYRTPIFWITTEKNYNYAAYFNPRHLFHFKSEHRF